MIPFASTRLIVASLYTLPLIVLKSSANASDADRSGKIAIVVGQSFTRGAFCLSSSPESNDKMRDRSFYNRQSSAVEARSSEAERVCAFPCHQSDSHLFSTGCSHTL